MSGRTFDFDGARDWTAAELWALDEVGVSYEELTEILTSAGKGIPPGRALRAMCALAYVAALREDPKTTWAELSRSLVPASFEVVEDQPAQASAATAERAEQLAAASALSLTDLAARVNQLMAEREAVKTAS